MWGWQAALLAVALFGAVALASSNGVPGDRPHAARDATRPARVRQCQVVGPDVPRLGRAAGCSYGGLFSCWRARRSSSSGCWASAAPPTAASAANSVAYIGGTFLCRRLLAPHGLRRAVRRGGWFSLAGGAGWSG